MPCSWRWYRCFRHPCALLLQLLVEEMHVVAPLMALDRAARTDRIGLEAERNQGACTKAWGRACMRHVGKFGNRFASACCLLLRHALRGLNVSDDGCVVNWRQPEAFWRFA